MGITDFLTKPTAITGLNPSRSLSKGAQAIYCLTEQTGTIRDSSGFNYDLTPTASLVYTTGGSGRALGYGNLQNAKRTISSALDPIANLTYWSIACRVRITANTNNSLLFGYVSGSAPFEQYSWWCKGSDHTFMEVDGTGNNENLRLTGVAATDGQWHMLVATYDHANVRCYVDGVQVVNAAVVGSAPGLGGTLTIGNTATGNFAVGQIDFAGLWSRAISPVEIEQLQADPFTMFRHRRNIALSTLATPSPQTVSPTAIGSTPTFGTLTISVSPVTLSPTAIGSTQTFGTPAISVSAVTVSPTAIGSTPSFGTPAISVSAVTLSPTAIGSTPTFGAPAVNLSAVTVSPTAIGSTPTFGTATIGVSGVTLSPDAIVSTPSFGTATVSRGSQTRYPSGWSLVSRFGTPTLVNGSVKVSPTSIGSTPLFATPTIVNGALALAVRAIESLPQIGLPELTLSSVNMTPASIVSTPLFGVPAVLGAIPGPIRSTVFRSTVKATISSGSYRSTISGR